MLWPRIYSNFPESTSIYFATQTYSDPLLKPCKVLFQNTCESCSKHNLGKVYIVTGNTALKILTLNQNIGEMTSRRMLKFGQDVFKVFFIF